MTKGISITSDAARLYKLLDTDVRKGYDSVETFSNTLSRRMLSRIRHRIVMLGHYKKGGHNTPSPLINQLKWKKAKKGEYDVYMSRGHGGSTGTQWVNPEWVEFGTKPHQIPFTRGGSPWGKKSSVTKQRRMWDHPGAKGRYYFWNGLQDFVNKDFKAIVDTTSDGKGSFKHMLPDLVHDFGKK